MEGSENSKYVDFFGIAGNSIPSWFSEVGEVFFSASETEFALSEISTTGTISSDSSDESELAQEKMAKRKTKIEAKKKLVLIFIIIFYEVRIYMLFSRLDIEKRPKKYNTRNYHKQRQ